MLRHADREEESGEPEEGVHRREREEHEEDPSGLAEVERGGVEMAVRREGFEEHVAENDLRKMHFSGKKCIFHGKNAFFRAKMHFSEFGNFRRLFLGCIGTSDSESRRIFQDFSKSTRSAFFCTAPTLI